MPVTVLKLLQDLRRRRIWGDAEAFRPERFLERPPGICEFIPQVAGDPHMTHRCPGEAITVELMKAAVKLLLSMDYEVSEQDLSVDLSRIPARPRSGFLIRLNDTTAT
jgi:fatty-acid peroxygenase